MSAAEHDPAHEAPHGLAQLREHLKHGVHHFAHMLSEQGPMNITFVHNNTLLGLQSRHFEAAIDEAARVLGGRGYLSAAEYREHHARGRIGDADIDRSLDARKELLSREPPASVGGRPILAREVLRVHMVHGVDATDPATLRYQIQEADALRRLQPDLPAAARQALLAKAERALLAGLARIGVDWTLAHWLQALLGVDLPHAVRPAVLGQVPRGAASAGEVEGALAALGVPVERHAGYLACVDRMLELEEPAGAERDRLRALALREEAALCGAISRRHLDIAGTFSSLSAALRVDLEHYATRALWQAALARCAIQDPFSPTDPGSLREREPDAEAAESLDETAQAIREGGGPPTPLSAALRATIEALVGAELESLKDAAGGGARERGQLCWTLLHELGERQLGWRGVQALEALAAQRKEGELAGLLDEVHALDPRARMLEQVRRALETDIAGLGTGRTHADLLGWLTGEDPAEQVNPYMIRVCSAFMDEGLAAWRMPGRALGFYDTWRNFAAADRSFDVDRLPGWRDALGQLPTLAEDALIQMLGALGVPESHWAEYLGRMLARLKGWAGMAYWYELHPQHYKQSVQPVDTIQYLAVRLFYESQLVRRVCRENWHLDGSVAGLRQYFAAHPAEYLVRRELYAGCLPETLAASARELVARSRRESCDESAWLPLADALWAWRARRAPLDTAARQCWRLFRLAQLLGWDAGDVSGLSDAERDRLMDALDAFPEEKQGPVWLDAFERHYRDEVLNALALNRGRGRWAKGRTRRPKSQVVFCIDEREENIHRHYEELDPEHETLGAAGFFGVAMDYSGLDEHSHTPLCPAVVTPAHRVFEVARPESEHTELPRRQRRRKWLDVFHESYWETKRNVVGSYFLIDLAGFLTAIPLLGRVFAPVRFDGLLADADAAFVPGVRTRLTVTREGDAAHAHARGKPVGFTDTEAADRVETGLRNWGLTGQFSPIVVICGHGSRSLNNPHENAHDCGACGGKHGSANARAFAAMANRKEVRELLRARGIDVPQDCWFVGAIHNTASDLLTFYDTEDVPQPLREHFDLVTRDLWEAARRSARERCRRFQASPKDASPEASLRHAVERSTDISQVRPEWGHATNAFAVVGRRMITQGVFLDRRGFVISYDPTQDPDGKILERIILAVGPVGAGINLEYYFSTVDPKVYGCDTKVPHNVTGMIGVMAGALSDLQTGLPRQMTEVHEAMRLQLIIDAKMEVLGAIYGRQPAVQQLLNGQWVHLIAHDPDSGEFNLFVPGTGFVKWDEPLRPIPSVRDSFEWFKGKYNGFLPPALIAEPARSWQAQAGTR